MAGPGGGPPRRSHTKSRKGCDACKRRHIRCDETFPQCLNCTKHKIRCPYNDMPVDRSGSPDKSSIVWADDVVRIADQWLNTLMWPFPMLNVFNFVNPKMLKLEDLRLLCHICLVCSELGSQSNLGLTVWSTQMVDILSFAAVSPFVMNAVLSFSATHLSSIRDSTAIRNMAFSHQGRALKGLSDALQHFSPENSDSVLAASVVLSWQTTEWREWSKHMYGTLSFSALVTKNTKQTQTLTPPTQIIDLMRQGNYPSRFQSFIDNQHVTVMAPPSPSPDHKTIQPKKEDMDVMQRTVQQLQVLEAHLKGSGMDCKDVQNLINFVKNARKASSSGLTVQQQHEKLAPLRSWLFWQPLKYLSPMNSSYSGLVIIAHLYSVALVMERLFPDIGAGYFGSLTVQPILDIFDRIYHASVSGDPTISALLTLMRGPFNTATEFQQRRGLALPQMPMLPATTSASDAMYVAAAGTPTASYYPVSEAPSTPSMIFAAPAGSPAFPPETLPFLDSPVNTMAMMSPALPTNPYLSVPSPGYVASGSPYSAASSPATNYETTAYVADPTSFGSEWNPAPWPMMPEYSSMASECVSPLMTTALLY
ncbi:hypothetical protein TD95_005178 [Thielaviopsis punctulata]|uniref:Zn(2)-C6 fungal-type domain-containing protein n=1 Tax=Thielaviopsis punctulata TaxID=72032 RepID=A0A0F4ZA37_9PEZI|nr:hypothetical protein TD95_005178 [Thielaviopsis punctulata]